ncbi:MAG: nicotinate phosphoribosyltransferase [Magnetospirillum sp.]|nr:nicotinate phosphoribosyltransferase [Magnetospirillum sp.]
MPGSSGILQTDLYQLAMMQAYFREGMGEPAAFEFFVRNLPTERNFLIAAGLEQALQYLEALAPTARETEWLKSSGQFDGDFLDWLAALRFAGDVDAIPEGVVVFADEPILRLVAPIAVAQLVETRLINLLHFQTLIASKAARLVLAAQGRLLVDFGYRRAHGAEAGLLAARAAYLAGFAGTATVAAGVEFGIPLYGTMAHSFIQAHAGEEDAFLAFARARPSRLVLLIDTYDTERAAATVANLIPRLAADGITVQGVRIDSGDLGLHAHSVRAILDAHGCRSVTIFASGGLDEMEIARLLARGAPIDGFGIGTSLTTSSDVPALDCAYKLQEYAGIARRKTSEGKATWPGRKQVFRTTGDDGRLAGDVLALVDERYDGMPLLRPVLRAGRRVQPAEPLQAIRERVADGLSRLPEPLRRMSAAPAYPVVPSLGVRRLAEEVDRRVAPPPTPTQTPTGWEHFPHGSDVGVRGYGPSFAGALEQAALGLTAVVADPAGVDPVTAVAITCAAGNPEDLLYQWLNAVISEMATRGMAFSRYAIAVDGTALNARAWGERLSAGRHHPAAEPKGATSAELAVRRGEDACWSVQCVIEV